MKYRTKKDYRTTLNNITGKVNFIPKDTVSTFKDGCHIFEENDGNTWAISANILENDKDWFEPVEEPIISEGEEYWYIDEYGDVLSRVYTEDSTLLRQLEYGNIYVCNPFTRAEVEAHAEDIKQLNKDFQLSK